MSETRVAAIVLAAGGSSRLGRPKQLLNIGDKPLLGRTLDVVRSSRLDPRVLVLGSHADAIERAVETGDFAVVRNERHADGQATSLRAGLAALPDDVGAAVVVLGDQPLVPFWLLDELAARFDPARHVAVRPRYADGPGNPALLSRELFPELMMLDGDVGARDVLRRHRERVFEIDWTARRAPRDVDTTEDYATLLLDWAASGAPDVPRYCQRCASEVVFRDVHGRYRPVCPRCGFTYFYDPKIATAVIIAIDGRIVLQRRAGDPGRGKWTYPGGFVDRGEAIRDAAIREASEEVNLNVSNLELLGVYAESGETVVLVAFAADAPGQAPTIGDESTEVGLFEPGDLPQFAFPRDPLVLRDWLKR